MRLQHYQALPAAGPALPQLILQDDGSFRRVEPHLWGITIAQCRALMDSVRRDQAHLWNPDYNIEELVEYYIKPWTANTGMGYSLMVNAAAPKEVNVMVSHAWKENAKEFFETLERSVSADDVMYICCLANYQHNDGYGPTVAQQLGQSPEESPFRKVLDHIGRRAKPSGLGCFRSEVVRSLPMVFLTVSIASLFPAMFAEHCVPTFTHCARLVKYDSFPEDEEVFEHQWEFLELKWRYRFCLPLALAALALAASTLVIMLLCRPRVGRMIAVPCRETDLYGRLWCVYEIFCAVDILKVPVDLAGNLVGAGNDEVILSMEFDNVDQQLVLGSADLHASLRSKLQQSVADIAGWSAHRCRRWPLWGELQLEPMGRRSVSVRMTITPPGANTAKQICKMLLRRTSWAAVLEQSFTEVLVMGEDEPSVRNIAAVVRQSSSPTLKATCGSADDRSRIQRAIEKRALDTGRRAEEGYMSVDSAISATTRLHWASTKTWFFRLFIFIYCSILSRARIYALKIDPQFSDSIFESAAVMAYLPGMPVFFLFFFRLVFRQRGAIKLHSFVKFAGKFAAPVPCLFIGGYFRNAEARGATASATRSCLAGAFFGLGLSSCWCVALTVLIFLFCGLGMPLLQYIGDCCGKRWQSRLIWAIPCLVNMMGILTVFSLETRDRLPSTILLGTSFVSDLLLAYFLIHLLNWGIKLDIFSLHTSRAEQKHESGIIRFVIEGEHGHCHFRVHESQHIGFCIDEFCNRFSLHQEDFRFVLATDHTKVVVPAESIEASGVTDGGTIQCVGRRVYVV